jgi:hypothetical protein
MDSVRKKEPRKVVHETLPDARTTTLAGSVSANLLQSAVALAAQLVDLAIQTAHDL